MNEHYVKLSLVFLHISRCIVFYFLCRSWIQHQCLTPWINEKKDFQILQKKHSVFESYPLILGKGILIHRILSLHKVEICNNFLRAHELLLEG